MRAITAPYGFVPLSKTVVRPEWVQPRERDGGALVVPPLHDRPFLDGISGTFELVIEAETPIFCRGTRSPERPFEVGDGGSAQFAIPGTSLRGTLRNVLEIATFGLMSRVNDHRYAVRDLQNRDLYGRFMAEIVKNERTGKGEPMPLVNAGWLVRDPEGRYSITVCDFAKIEYELLKKAAIEKGIRGFDPTRKQSSVKKYQNWGSASREIAVKAMLDLRPRQVGSTAMVSFFGKVAALGGAQKGTLVFTGQPTDYRPDTTGQRRGAGKAKHHDFVFFETQGEIRELRVTEKVFKDFAFAHSDQGQQNRLSESETPNDEWAFWQAKLEAGQRVPVFFLTDERGRDVRAFGLAMMFRLPYRNSVGEALRRVHPPDHAALDFAEGLFGTVNDELALKGRVAIGHAIAEGRPQPLDAVKVVLGTPKASYYPNYVEQDPEVPGAQPPRTPKGARYTTWQDDFGRPRGWKRYHPLTSTWQPKLPTSVEGKSLDDVITKFRPLPAQTKFRAKVAVHNLRPAELGALLWAIEFGGNATARHTLGMARPLGYGRARIAVERPELRDIADAPADLAAARATFAAYMEKQVPGWKTSVQIEALLRLAQPIPPEQAYYQRLDPVARVNEFVDAKKAGLALPGAHRDMGNAVLRVRMEDAATVVRNAPPPNRGSHNAGSPSRPGPSVPVRPVAPVMPIRAGWPERKRGDVLKVRLKELNKKGKWRAEVVGFEAIGTLEGTAPAGVEIGQEHEVEVITGSDPKNLNLKWK